MNGKIAPGTKGKFTIQIKSNKKSKYEVKFRSETEKPSNLKFYYKEKGYSTLEELEEKTKGQILSKQLKEIEIQWKWEYENGDDNIDTQNGKNISKYKFEVGVIGEQI